MNAIKETQQESFNTATNGDEKRMLVLEAIRKNHGATLFELVRILNWPVNRISGRVTELAKRGLIVEVGAKINPESGKRGAVWAWIAHARLCGGCDKWFFTKTGLDRCPNHGS